MKPLRTGLLAGAIAGLVMTAFFLFVRAAFDIATPSELFADRIAPLIPVHLFGILIGVFGGYNALKIVGFVSVLGGQIVVACAAGAVYARRGWRTADIVAIAAVMWVVAVIAFWPVLITSYHGLPPRSATAVNIVSLLAGFAIFAAAASLVAAAFRKPSEQDASRGRFLAGGSAVVSAIFSGLILGALFKRAVFAYDGKDYKGADVQDITPNDRFYLVTKNTIDPNPDAGEWRLEVAGAVDRSGSYTLDQLRALPSVAQETTLMCINNAVDGGLMSNALWKGVPLRTLIAAARPAGDVKGVSMQSVDNIIDTISFAKAMEPTTLVAYEMNGEPLPVRHGYPVRMIVPGLFGLKNVKWLTKIRLETTESQGFYERQGWGPSFSIPTHSRFDVPDFEKPIARGSTVSLAGVAFAGNRGVSAVQVSTDDGTSWNDATLVTRFSSLTWRRWHYDWRPDTAGLYRLAVRAFDAHGVAQIATDRPAETQGVTGLHRVTAHVA